MATAVNTLVIFVCLSVLFPFIEVAKQKTNLLNKVDDIKEWKKLLRTKTNVLALFIESEKILSSRLAMCNDVADAVRGQATIAYVDCGAEKKLCKKLKASPNPFELKHYKDGDFNKNYDRKLAIKSMISFLRDPTGDLPWDEDATADDVIHVEDPKQLNKILTKEKLPLLVMFYAPWCGYCKRIKPDYAAAATELKGHSLLVGIDVDKPENMPVRTDYNITGFPTLLYFEKGQMKYKFGGENNKEGIISWMKNPGPPKEPEKEVEWADSDNDVVHLTEATFDTYMSENPSVLVMFYAPWCGHCKKMKPEYEVAAAKLKEEGIEGSIAAVDATKEKSLGEKYKVKGFPTVKYFKDGEPVWDYNERTSDKMIEFLKDPKEPPPPPPPEPEWSDSPSEVIHLDDSNFKSYLKKKKHVLVMFYAPWCGHCKKAKPEMVDAAAEFTNDQKVKFAGIDCTKHTATCGDHDVTGYPTFKYFNYGKNEQKYAGGREKADFVNFMKDPTNPLSSMPPPPPSPEVNWSDAVGHENVHHVSTSNFDNFLKEHSSVLVMFYAPWCGHCKTMKPAYAEAATKLKESNSAGVLAAVDATIEADLASKYQIQGFPTLKYFSNGKEAFDYNSGRKADDLIGFMKNPVQKEPPKPEPKWSDEPSSVNHLTDENFESSIKEKSAVLVMFYAPWCGHCKKAKPSFVAAADALSNSDNVAVAAVDCTSSTTVCSANEVKGYPTFKLFKRGVYAENYDGGRSSDDFVKYLKTFAGGSDKKEEL